jgi:hypothetical protein
MSSRAGLKIAFFVSARKTLSARFNPPFLIGFLVLLGYLWTADSFALSFRAFLALSPYIFLFLSQDMMREEIESGALENVLFLRGDFRRYLWLKNGVVTAIAVGISGALFLAFLAYALASHQFPRESLARFLNGQVAGIYYVSLAGLFSFFLRAGSNVLLIILGQILFLAGLLLSVGQKSSWIDRLAGSSLPGWGAKLEFLASAAVFPNLLAGQKPGWPSLGLAILALAWLGLQWALLSRLEFRRK